MTDFIDVNYIKRITGGDAFIARDLDESIDDTKLQTHNIGQIKAQERQPLEGRINQDNLKLGEIERDAILEYGANVYSKI